MPVVQKIDYFSANSYRLDPNTIKVVKDIARQKVQVSGTGLRATLFQYQVGEQRVISPIRRTLAKAERK